jgi:hypothetical protein
MVASADVRLEERRSAPAKVYMRSLVGLHFLVASSSCSGSGGVLGGQLAEALIELVVLGGEIVVLLVRML